MPPLSPNERIQDMLRHFPTILARWSGATARMTELTRSHATLRIELRFPGSPGHLRIACIDPVFIHGPTAWQSAQLAVELLPSELVELRDTVADVRITAGKVEIAEIQGSP